MFHLVIRVKPQSRAYEITEKEVQEAAIKSLQASDKRNIIRLEDISTDTRSVIAEEGGRMKGQVEILIFTSMPVWVALGIENKMERFLQSMKRELRRLKEGDLSVFVIDAQHYSA